MTQKEKVRSHAAVPKKFTAFARKPPDKAKVKEREKIICMIISLTGREEVWEEGEGDMLDPQNASPHIMQVCLPGPPLHEGIESPGSPNMKERVVKYGI